MSKILSALMSREFIIAILGLAAMVFGLLGNSTLQSFFSNPSVVEAIQAILVALGGASGGVAVVAAKLSEPPK